jgi:hypothetical protein
MSLKLFTIGDSISQGFMSGAAARTDLSYSTLIARSMGLGPGPAAQPGTDYYYPDWPEGGLPANLEEILRALEERLGPEITGLEWLSVLKIVNSVLDRAEDYYERGPGRANAPYPGNVPFFHNVSVRDFDVADSWLVTPGLCRKKIAKAGRALFQDGFMTGPDVPVFRTALKVLDPNLDHERSQLDWLSHHAKGEGVENLILWLGSNNALWTVLDLEVRETPGNGSLKPHTLDYDSRRSNRWNLWHPDDFEAEYRALMDKVDAAMQNNVHKGWHVFAGTVPRVTSIPFLAGFGSRTEEPGLGKYSEYYTYFPFTERFVEHTGLCLTRAQAVHIDRNILAYNASIRLILREKDPNRYHIVDMCACLEESMGLGHTGLFSLDNIHPAAIFHGNMAEEFMKVMKDEAGVNFPRPLDWEAVRKSDSLLQRPVALVKELYRHNDLARHVVRLIGLFGKRPVDLFLPRKA